MRSPLLAVLTVSAAAATLAACDVGGPETPDYLNYDAAVVAADGAAEDLRMMHGPGLGLPGIVFPPLDGSKPNCPETDRRFHCNPVVRDGLDYTRTITYLDADGDPLEEFDEATTDGIHYEISVKGDLSREFWSATIDRQRDLTVTGLLDDNNENVEGDGVVTWKGSGSGEVHRSRHMDGVERSYDMLSSAQINDVVIPFPRTEEGWPESGTIVRSIDMTFTTRDGETKNISRTATITFNGTQFVPVTVGEETFTMDLGLRDFGPRGMHGGPGGRRGRP